MRHRNLDLRLGGSTSPGRQNSAQKGKPTSPTLRPQVRQVLGQMHRMRILCPAVRMMTGRRLKKVKVYTVHGFRPI